MRRRDRRDTPKDEAKMKPIKQSPDEGDRIVLDDEKGQIKDRHPWRPARSDSGKELFANVPGEKYTSVSAPGSPGALDIAMNNIQPGGTGYMTELFTENNKSGLTRDLIDALFPMFEEASSGAGSFTHLTLPTLHHVCFSEGAFSLRLSRTHHINRVL